MAANKKKVRIEFTDGPSREDLFLALRLYIDSQGGRLVTFIDANGAKYLAHITGIEWADGSEHHWNIKGYLLGTPELRSAPFIGSCHTNAPRSGYAEYEV